MQWFLWSREICKIKSVFLDKEYIWDMLKCAFKLFYLFIYFIYEYHYTIYEPCYWEKKFSLYLKEGIGCCVNGLTFGYKKKKYIYIYIYIYEKLLVRLCDSDLFCFLFIIYLFKLALFLLNTGCLATVRAGFNTFQHF